MQPLSFESICGDGDVGLLVGAGDGIREGSGLGNGVGTMLFRGVTSKQHFLALS